MFVSHSAAVIKVKFLLVYNLIVINTFIIGCLASQGVRPAAWVLIRASRSPCASIAETILHPLFPMENMLWFIGSRGMKCIHVRIIFVLSSCTFQEKLSANFPWPKVRCVCISVNSLAVWLFDSSRIPIRSVIFHPQNPLLFICTGLHVQIYDLQRQVLLRKLSTGTRRLSCMAIHSGGFFWILRKQKSQFSPEAMPCARTGENIIVGSEDGKLSWLKARCQRLDWQMFLILALLFRFDLELSITPYKVLGSHAGAIKVTSRYVLVPLWWEIEPLLHRTSVFIQNTLCLPQVLMMQLSMYFMEWYTLI